MNPSIGMRRGCCLLAGVAWAALSLAPAPAAGKAPRAKQLAAGVTGWWIMNGGQTLVIADGESFRTCRPKAGEPELLFKGKPMRAPKRINDTTIGYEIRGEGYALLDVTTGKSTVCVSGKGNYQAHGVRPGRGWFILMRPQSGPKMGFAFFRVEIATGKAARVYDTGDKYGVEHVTVRRDGSQLVVVTESDRAETMIRRTVNLRTRAVAVKKVTRKSIESPAAPDRSWVLGRGKGTLVEKGNRVWIRKGKARKDLLKGPAGLARVYPNLAESPDRVVVARLADTNGDGRIDRGGGDRIDLWLVKIAKAHPVAIANAKQENVVRGWSPDGNYFVLNRIFDQSNKSGDRGGQVVAYSKRTNRLVRFRPPDDADYVHYHGFPGPDRMLLSYSQKRRPRGLVLIDLTARRAVVEWIKGATPHNPTGQIVGDTLIFSVEDPKTKLRQVYRWKLPSR